MKWFMLLVCASLLTGTLAGCGSLKQNPSWDGLTQADIEYAKSLTLNDADGSLELGVLDQNFITFQGVSRYVSLVVFHYSKSFGADLDSRGTPESYGASRITYILPIFFGDKTVLYDTSGSPQGKGSHFLIPFIFMRNIADDQLNDKYYSRHRLMPVPFGIDLYDRSAYREKSTSLVHNQFLSLPLLGACFSFGDGQNKFLWIPYGPNRIQEFADTQ